MDVYFVRYSGCIVCDNVLTEEVGIKVPRRQGNVFLRFVREFEKNQDQRISRCVLIKAAKMSGNCLGVLQFKT